MKTRLVLLSLIVVALLTSCTQRLVDFTVISTKNAEIGVDRAKGVMTEGKKTYFFTPWNLKDAIDNALENAGPQYDLLIDGVVEYRSIFGVTIMVKGLAVSSSDLRAELGEEEYNKFLEEHKLQDPQSEINNRVAEDKF